MLALLGPRVREGIEVDAAGRNAVGPPEGLDILRLSRSFSFGGDGDGESSMMRTHPEESPLDSFAFLSDPLSLLRLESALRLLARLSQLVFAVEPLLDDDDDDDTLAFAARVDIARVLALGLPVMLPIRNLGTRVWIFCSRLRTRARISETICTPLFLDVVLVVDIVLFELLVGFGRATGVRGLDEGL